MILAVCLGIAILTRLWGLDLVVTADEGYWMQRTLRFGAALERGDLSSTFRSGHPGVTVMWTGLLGIGRAGAQALADSRYLRLETLERAPSYRDAMASARLLIAVVTSALITLAIGLAWRLLGTGPALVGGALLLLDPYTVGMTRLLHVDTLLAPLMLVAAFAALVYWLGGLQRRYLVLSAVMTGLALLTKPPAVVIGLLFVGVGVVTWWRSSEQRASVVRAILTWSAIVAATFVACWPAMWLDPVGRITAMVQFALAEGAQPHEGGTYFLGHAMISDPGGLFYPVAFAFRLGVVPCIGLVCLLLVRRQDASPAALLALTAYVLVFVAVMSLGAKKLDRYLLPALMAANILAGVGIWSIARFASRLRVLVLALAVLAQTAFFVTTQPYPIAAYNPLLGGAATAQRLMTVGWGEGLDQVTDFLNAQPGAENLTIATNYQDIVRPRFVGTTYPLTNLPPNVTSRVDLVVLYISTAQRGRMAPLTQVAIAGGPPIFTARVRGEEYAWVFLVPKGVLVPASPDEPDDDPEIDDLLERE